MTIMSDAINPQYEDRLQENIKSLEKILQIRRAHGFLDNSMLSLEVKKLIKLWKSKAKDS
jgi:hypothetical protein